MPLHTLNITFKLLHTIRTIQQIDFYSLEARWLIHGKIRYLSGIMHYLGICRALTSLLKVCDIVHRENQ